MQHRHPRLTKPEPLVGQTEIPVITVEIGEQMLTHSLLLETQGHHGIHIGQGELQIPADAD